MRSTVNWSSARRAYQFWQDFFGDILDGFLHALAEKTGFVAVAQLDGFMFASAGAARHRRASGRTGLQRHIHFHGWIAARIENLSRLNSLDFCHI